MVERNREAMQTVYRRHVVQSFLARPQVAGCVFWNQAEGRVQRLAAGHLGPCYILAICGRRV
jgi:hypothetical protein